MPVKNLNLCLRFIYVFRSKLFH